MMNTWKGLSTKMKQVKLTNAVLHCQIKNTSKGQGHGSGGTPVSPGLRTKPNSCSKPLLSKSPILGLESFVGRHPKRSSQEEGRYARLFDNCAVVSRNGPLSLAAHAMLEVRGKVAFVDSYWAEGK